MTIFHPLPSHFECCHRERKALLILKNDTLQPLATLPRGTTRIFPNPIHGGVALLVDLDFPRRQKFLTDDGCWKQPTICMAAVVTALSKFCEILICNSSTRGVAQSPPSKQRAKYKWKLWFHGIYGVHSKRVELEQNTVPSFPGAGSRKWPAKTTSTPTHGNGDGKIC